MKPSSKHVYTEPHPETASENEPAVELRDPFPLPFIGELSSSNRPRNAC